MDGYKRKFNFKRNKKVKLVKNGIELESIMNFCNVVYIYTVCILCVPGGDSLERAGEAKTLL